MRCYVASVEVIQKLFSENKFVANAFFENILAIGSNNL